MVPRTLYRAKTRENRTFCGESQQRDCARRFATTTDLPLASCPVTRRLNSFAITLALAIFFAVADRLSGFASEDIANDDVA